MIEMALVVGLVSGQTGLYFSDTQEQFRCEVTCRRVLVPIVDAGSSPDAGPGPQDSGVPSPDAGVADAGTAADAGTQVAWSLRTQGNRILNKDGTPFWGRGANVFDTRMCGACTNENWLEVRRKLSVAVNDWGMNFLRLNLENASTANDAYFEGLRGTIEYMRLNHPNTYVMVAVWSDSVALTSAPNDNPNGGPTPNAVPLWRRLGTFLRDEPNVLFGCSNEPRSQTDAQVWEGMRLCVDTIRETEAVGQPHIVVVQGTQQWGRTLGYYVGRSLGPNVAYEAHFYDAESYWKAQLDGAATLPRIIGEFGTGSQMTQASVDALMKYAEANDIPWLAWSFTRLCSPDMIAPSSANSRCSAGTWTPSVYGQTIKDRLAKPWGSP